MEKLLQITSTFGEERGLIFNPAKSAVLEFNRVDDTTDKNLFIQGKIIPKERTYKYLGIHLSTDANYLEDQEKIWKEKTRKALYQLHAKVLWKFNRFETTKIQWKATCVPALTYCNTVTVMSNTLRKNIESAQRQAARWALGEPACNLANEFLKGELGWSTFEEREAKSKITYFKRIQEMADERWAKQMLTMMSINNAKIKAVERLKTLSLKYDCDNIVVKRSEAGEACLNTFKKSVEKKIPRFSPSRMERRHEQKVQPRKVSKTQTTMRYH
ncbi:uncharacterized protein LOC108865225 [Galendromus occidentalis]|uniref:Uncharacterized protein LOC108865225 n=1 Tax=Galendromus occidentalis TaxID=34638 RepID=A0AAJ7L890_9ACAR|nr:uncharacterized protein LOC108865225 [Galendromus occidentalis]